MDEKDLKILRLFLKKIKLNIDEILIDSLVFDIMKKEDFDIIKPLHVEICSENETCLDVSILPSNLKSLKLSFFCDSPLVSN